MMLITRIARAAALAAAVALAAAPAALAQSYPNKPVRIILPYPAAVGPDIVMRMVAEKLTKSWGQQVIVDNRPGGNAFIAMNAVKAAPADGYTFAQIDAAIVAVTPHVYRSLPFDPARDFIPVAPMYRTHFFVTVAADSPWQSVADLLAAARAKNGALAYGSSGVASHMHLGGAMMETAGEVKMTHVPYKETGQVFADISRGDIGWAFGSPATTANLYQAKRIRYLGLAAPSRHPNFPDVPTVAEAGGPKNFELQTWVAVLAPAGTPVDIIGRVNADINKAMAEPDIRERLNTMGFQPWSGTAADVASAQQKDFQAYGAVVKRLNISLD